MAVTLALFETACWHAPYYYAPRDDWHQQDHSFVRVQKDDTLYSIARRYDVDLRDLIELNRIQAPFRIVVGQYVKLPKRQIHVVRPKQTIYDIAALYDTDVTSLIAHNHLKAPYIVRTGQRIKIGHSRSQPQKKPAAGQARANQPLPESRPEARVPTPIAHAYKRTDSHNPPTPQRPKGNAQPLSAPGSSRQKNAVLRPAPTAKTHHKKPAKEPKTPITDTARGGGNVVFKAPLAGKIISKFGLQKSGLYNQGINIAAPRGRRVRACAPGRIAFASDMLKGYGNLVLIKHEDGYISAYAHLEEMQVKRGDKVKAGAVIGRVGTTGSVTKPQLHFELRQKSKSLDPEKYMKL